MFVKSETISKHFNDLGECFDILRMYRMKLNSTKYAFGVRGGKFLGIMISQRGIEDNLEKIKAVIDLPLPRTIKEVQRLTEHMAASIILS